MKITFQPEQQTIDIQPEQTLLESAQTAGIALTATCGGKGRCRSCRIHLLDGTFSPPTDREISALSEQEISDGVRLACQTHAADDGSVYIIPAVSEQSIRILTQTETHSYPIAPDIQKQYLALPEFAEEQQTSDFEEIQRIASEVNRIEFAALQQLPTAIFQASRKITITRRNHEIIAVEPGDTTESLYGIAFDIGTTTVVGYLMDLRSGKQLAIASALNGQTMYGGDVMSRLTFAQREKSGRRKLQQRVVETLNGMIEQLCEHAQVDRQQIYEITVVGNSCMHHLLLNIDPVHLGLAPYMAAIRQRYICRASDLGLHVLPQARVILLPLIASFVGADTVAVILATDMHNCQHLTLAVDIGTNGEIVLGTKERLITCSTAAGTAFEGAQISHGMRGAIGAIEKVRIDDDAHCQVIGNIPARGICGSGLVDAIAQMLDAGLIDSSGRLRTAEQLEASISPKIRARLVKTSRHKQFILLDSNHTENGESLVITQHDIRELQLAKGAICAGITMLMKRFGVQADDIDDVLLAGAFGNYLDKESALRIGLLPAIPREKIRSVGNAAGLGAQMALLSANAQQAADQIARTAEHIALTNDPEFQEIFAAAMAFPEKRT